MPDSHENSPAPSSGAGAGERALRVRASGFVQDWRASLARRWDAERAAALYDELERLAELAERQDEHDIAEPVLELTVYLCSFVDRHSVPSAAQRQGLERLIDQLSVACGEGAARRAAQGAAKTADATHRQAFYLRSASEEIPGLAARLGQLGHIVRPLAEREALIAALEEASPDLLLIAESFAAEVHDIVESVQRQRPAHKEAALCVVLATETDLSRTLFAQRAGADAVLVERDPIPLLAQIDTLRAQVRALGYRVLIVEDDRGQAKFCESILRHRGMLTQVCEDAASVPAALADFKPDLVLLDLYLPGSNGIEVAQRIRAGGNAFLPIVFLSGELDPDLRFDAIRMGADDFITKPVKPRHLVTAVESRIRRARQLVAAHGEARSERRGSLSGRDVLAAEILRAAREESERCPVLALVAVDDAAQVVGQCGFVAASALGQQLAGALAAEIRGERTLCAWGELKFLVLLHAEDELAVRGQLGQLRDALAARQWLSEQAPLRLELSVGCLRLGARVAGIEPVLKRVLELCDQAQQAGGARCEFDLRDAAADAGEDPQLRMVRAMLRAPGLRGVSRFEFQPLLPLGGRLAHQYQARMALQPPKSRQGLLLQREQFLPLARGMEMIAHADRHQIRGLVEHLRDSGGAHADLRLYVPIAVESLLDTAFAPWLAAEFGARAATAGRFVLQFHAAELGTATTPLRAGLEALQRVGVRLALCIGPDQRSRLADWLSLDAFGVVEFEPMRDATGADSAWEPWADAFVRARSLGKTTVARGVGDVAEMGALLRLGVHYARGDALAGWLPDWNFEFSEAVL